MNAHSILNYDYNLYCVFFVGWVPVENGNKQYCWHSSAVNYTLSVALVLKPRLEDPESLEICLVHLTDLLEQTLELVGTNINGNPYGKYFYIKILL